MRRFHWAVVAAALTALTFGVAVAVAGAPNFNRTPSSSLLTFDSTSSSTFSAARSGDSVTTASKPGTSTGTPTFAIEVSVSATGVGPGDYFEVEAAVSGTYGCLNGGSSVPADIKKFPFPATDGVFTVVGTPRNGKISATFASDTIAFPDASEIAFTCPPGQTATLVQAEFTNITVTAWDADDVKNNSLLADPSTLTWTRDGIKLN